MCRWFPSPKAVSQLQPIASVTLRSCRHHMDMSHALFCWFCMLEKGIWTIGGITTVHSVPGCMLISVRSRVYLTYYGMMRSVYRWVMGYKPSYNYRYGPTVTGYSLSITAWLALCNSYSSPCIYM